MIGDEPKERVDEMNKQARAEVEAYLKHIEQHFLDGNLAAFQLSVTSSVVSYSNAR